MGRQAMPGNTHRPLRHGRLVGFDRSLISSTQPLISIILRRLNPGIAINNRLVGRDCRLFEMTVVDMSICGRALIISSAKGSPASR